MKPSGGQYYQWYFQPPGVAEAVLEKDVRRFASECSSIPSAALFPRPTAGATCLGAMKPSSTPVPIQRPYPPGSPRPTWRCTPEHLKKNGFRGALNWYRTQDLWWEATPFLNRRPLEQPPVVYCRRRRSGGADFPGRRRKPAEKCPQPLAHSFCFGRRPLDRARKPPESVKPHLLEFLAAHT